MFGTFGNAAKSGCGARTPFEDVPQKTRINAKELWCNLGMLDDDDDDETNSLVMTRRIAR
jgi:hypothetical protein